MTTHDLITRGASGNAIGIAAMLASMAAFVANDTCVKIIGERLPLGELIVLRNGFATAYLLAFAAVMGGLSLPKNPQTRLLGWRLAGELLSTIFFLSGLIALPIADATAIGQFTPLAITAAAAVFLKEPVGWRRWLAAFLGLIGVLLIVRPGSAAFSPAALLILAAVATIVLRDLTTRYISSDVSTLTLTTMSAACGMLAGLMMMPFGGLIAPTATEVVLLLVSALFLTLGYVFIVIAMRNGEVAVVSPFRYAIILFAIASGYLVWGELPDAIQMAGIALLTAAGIYTFHRERLLLRGKLAVAPPSPH